MSASTDMVCPDCGHDTFTQIRTTRTKFSMQFDQRGGWLEIDDECIDGGDMGDHEIECDDCGWTCDNEAELVAREQYDLDELRQYLTAQELFGSGL